jgi:hypothetical protein
VGDVCSTAETKADPVAVVAALNRRLKGRGKAQATWPSSPPVLGGVTAERAVRNNISRIRDLGVRIGNQLI